MKVLVIQLGWAADVLLATPLLRCLKTQLNQTELHVLVRHEWGALLNQNPHVDHLHLLHFNWKTSAEALQLNHFDHVINLQESAEADAITKAVQPTHPPKGQKGFKTFFEQLFRGIKKEHPAVQYVKKAAPLGVTNDGAGLDYFIPRADRVPYADIPAAHQAGYLVVDVRMQQDSAWPLSFLQQLAAAIQHPIILTGTAADQALAEKVKAVDDIKIYNACGKFSLHEIGDLVAKAKLVVAAHPLTVQVAAALKKELVWLQAPRAVTPYYGSLFLKIRNTPAFDTLAIPQTLFTGSAADGEKASQQFVKEITAAISKRLLKLKLDNGVVV